MQSNELKKKLLDMLEEDKEFRYSVAGAIGYKEILDKFADLEARMDERFASMQEDMNNRFLAVDNRFLELEARMDERFAKIDERFASMQEDMNNRFLAVDNRFLELEARMDERFAKIDERFAKIDERFAKIEEEIRDLREESNKLRQDMQEGFRRHDEEFARVWQSIENLRKDMNEGFKRMDLKVSALGARWGIMNEESVREALKGIVGEELGYTISEWNTYDDEGYVYGYPSSIQLDIVVSNGKIIVIEIASHIKRSDSFMLKKKVELYKKKEGK
ncbi:MAG: DUF3782 domain-containing protein, partial [Candidatus Nitrosocaldaceae archaeon]